VTETDEPALLSIALTPKTPADRKKLRDGLGALTAEDPTVRVKTDAATDEVVIAGLGELHLDILVDRLRREFSVEASVGRPQVAYKETLTRPADGEVKYAKQTGGRGQYGHAKIHLAPGEPGSCYVFENAIYHGEIPDAFIKPIDEGIQEALTRAVLSGYPIDDVRVVLYDGSYHDLDSSAFAFRIAGSLAFQDAARKAKPVLLKPVMRVKVIVPDEHLHDVLVNIASRRGQVESRENRDGAQTIDALVPLAEMFGYPTDLRFRTRGRGTFTMRFARYQPFDPSENDDDRNSRVSAPRMPMPPLRNSSVALPEPAADDLDD
jgi:elongation factor G